MSKIKAEIFDNFGIIHIGNEVKTVKIESIIKAFSSVTTSIESPILPNNCIKYKEKGTNIELLLYHEPTTFNATVFKDLYENCCRPGLILKYVLTKQANGSYFLRNSLCFGVKDPYVALNDNTRLWGLPFPNINSHGGICWGANSATGTFTSLVGLKSYIDRLFGSPFNSHLFNSDLLRAVANIDGPRSFFEYIQNKEVFPYELFEGIGANYTIGKL